MQKKIGVGIGIAIGLAALFSLLGTPVSLLDVLKQPLQSILGSQQHLQTGVLEVSEHIEPLGKATRRLLQPFGSLRLTRRFPGTTPDKSKRQPDDAPSPGQ